MVWSWLINNLTLCLFLQITRLNKKYILTQVCYTYLYSSNKTSLRSTCKWCAHIIKIVNLHWVIPEEIHSTHPTNSMLEILVRGGGGGAKESGKPRQGGRGQKKNWKGGKFKKKPGEYFFWKKPPLTNFFVPPPPSFRLKTTLPTPPPPPDKNF